MLGLSAVTFVLLLAVTQQSCTAQVVEEVDEASAANWLDERGCCVDRKYNCNSLTNTSTLCEAESGKFYHTCDITALVNQNDSFWTEFFNGTCVTDKSLLQTSSTATNFSCFMRVIVNINIPTVLMVENLKNIIEDCSGDRRQRVECRYSSMKNCSDPPTTEVTDIPSPTLGSLSSPSIDPLLQPSSSQVLSGATHEPPGSPSSNSWWNTPTPTPTPRMSGSAVVPALVSMGVLLAVLNLILVCAMIIYCCCFRAREREQKVVCKTKTREMVTMAVGENSMQRNMTDGMNSSHVIHDSVDSAQHIYNTVNKGQPATHQ